MAPTINLCLVLHNHQPIGNFDGVFEQAFHDSYLPFLEVFEPFEWLSISLHTSGPLMFWIADRHPDYIRRLRCLVETGRVEIVGGPKYEPILTMIPKRDRLGQITDYTRWLGDTFGCQIGGIWTPERVWESYLTADLAKANIAYTVLDDFHFRAAGFENEQLTGYFITEEDGEVLRIFPGSEHLRYTIPFAPVQETINYCRQVAERHPNSVLVFGDDGEKFGTWPDTKQHVYADGWLRSFFQALTDNRDWLSTITLAEAVRTTQPAGKIYLPDCSYREMTEWSLPVTQQDSYESAVHFLDDHPHKKEITRFMRGGFWRNFKIKYTEAAEMYARMLDVSNRIAEAASSHFASEAIDAARDHLYRGQCNCSYWHGAFGGIYLPHLRNAVYHHLIAADTILELERCGDSPWVESTSGDYDFDGMLEVRLANDKAVCWVSPTRGGSMYELDVRGISHNLLATMQRRPEAYHKKVMAGNRNSQSDVASIHDRVVFKQEGLDQLLHYDSYSRKSLIDHFYDDEISVETVRRGEAVERGDFANLPFDAKLRRAQDRIQLQMARHGNAWGIPLKITKAVTVAAGSEILEIAYLIDQIPHGQAFHFGIEFNFAGLPSGADDRFFSSLNGDYLGQLGETLDLHEVAGLKLTDQWLGIEVDFNLDREASVWAFPIETVSQSEGGFELVHQSVCAIPHWVVRGDTEGRWAVKIRLALNCLRAPILRSSVRTAEFAI